MTNKLLLIILDGWGIAEDKSRSAIDLAQIPYIKSLYEKYPTSELIASGRAVGLPDGQMGNSEVGHLTIGAGRVVKQSLLRINDAIASGEFFKNRVLNEAFQYANTDNKAVHLLGLLSDGGVHSHISHAAALCKMAKDYRLKNVFLHTFTDGRDTMPKTATKFLREIKTCMQETTGQIATVVGRYYAMDRDNRWERTAVAYNAVTQGLGKVCKDWEDVENCLSESSLPSEEFLSPILILDENRQVPTIKPDDVIVSFNFRADRMRQLVHALTQQRGYHHNFSPISQYCVTMTEYSSDFKGCKIAFPKENLQDTVGHIISQSGRSQLRIAETEKYPHVTYFFSGGQEDTLPQEVRAMCDSPKVSTYDLAPEMAAHSITTKLIESLKRCQFDFICANFANPDMVGHTGNLKATIQACEVVDGCLSTIVPHALENSYTVLIISDHGNADEMVNKDGSVHTAHTSNTVPCILVSTDAQYRLRSGSLADIAPTILKIIGLDAPRTMTGGSLV